LRGIIIKKYICVVFVFYVPFLIPISLSDQLCGKEDFFVDNAGYLKRESSGLGNCLIDFDEKLLEEYVPVIVGLPKFNFSNIKSVNIPKIDYIQGLRMKSPLVITSGLEGDAKISRICSILKGEGKVVRKGYLGLTKRYSKKILELSLNESALAIATGRAYLYQVESEINKVGVLIVASDEYQVDIINKLENKVYISQATRFDLVRRVDFLIKSKGNYSEIPHRYRCGGQ